MPALLSVYQLTMPTASSNVDEAHPTASAATTNGNGGGASGDVLSAAVTDPNTSIPPTCAPFIPVAGPPSGCCAGEDCGSQSKVPLVYSMDSDVPGASSHFCHSCGGLYHCVLLCGQYVREVKGILGELGIKFDPHLLSPRGQHFILHWGGVKRWRCAICVLSGVRRLW